MSCPRPCYAIQLIKKDNAGEAWRAFSKHCALDPDSPTHLDSSCGPLTEIKLHEHWLAMAASSLAAACGP